MQKSLSVVGCFMSHALTEDRRASGELQRVLIHMEKEMAGDQPASGTKFFLYTQP